MRLLLLLLIPFSVLADSKHHYNTPIIYQNKPPLIDTDRYSSTTINNISTSTAGIASAMAAAGLQADYTSGMQISLGVGGYRGEHQFAIGGSYRPNLKGPLFFGTVGKDVYNASINFKLQ
mgnify:CR=1 FL=1